MAVILGILLLSACNMGHLSIRYETPPIHASSYYELIFISSPSDTASYKCKQKKTSHKGLLTTTVSDACMCCQD